MSATSRNDVEGEVELGLRRSVVEGSAHAVMVGLGEAYLVPWAIAVGADALIVGLLSSGPLMLGALAQLAAVRLLDRPTSRRKHAVIAVVAQALMYAPLLLLPWFVPSHGAELVLLAAIPYYVAAGWVVPSWNSWMGDLVAPSRRGDYFGRRERVRTYFQVTALALAGLVLWWARSTGREIIGFAIIFGGALIARLISAAWMARVPEPRYTPPVAAEQFTLRDFLRRSPRANFGRFTLYVAAFMAAASVASPFFTPYMLVDLRFSYGEFMLSTVAFVLGQALAFRGWGRIGDRFGNRRILKLTSLGIAVVPLPWLLTTHVAALVAIQTCSGILWGGFMLGTANFIFDAVTPAKRARCFAYYNTLVNAGVLLGATAGGWLAGHLPRTFTLPGVGLEVALTSHLYLLFALSSLLRLTAALVLLPAIREVRPVEPSSTWSVVVHVAGFMPGRGLRLGIFSGAHATETPVPPAVMEKEKEEVGADRKRNR